MLDSFFGKSALPAPANSYQKNNIATIAFGYLVLLSAAELFTTLYAPSADAVIFSALQIQYFVLLFVLCVHTAVKWGHPDARLLLTLTITPLVRIVSLSLPLAGFPIIYWFIFTSIPLFVSAVVIMRQLNLAYRRARVNGRYLLEQTVISLSGILIGYGEYLILRPEPIIASFRWQLIIFPAIVLLICTGFLEELIFRRMMQQVAIERLGYWFGMIYVAAIFAVLHIGYSSILDVAFVFLAGLLFGWFAEKTQSIVGVTAAHGLANIFLFLVMPFTGLDGAAFTLIPAAATFLQNNLLWFLLVMAGFSFMALLMREPTALPPTPPSCL